MKIEDYKISIVIPTFNRIGLLQRAIDSVLSQSLKPYEIIVVDDGSTDGTGDIIKQKYKSIKIIQQKNIRQGLGPGVWLVPLILKIKRVD